MEHRSAKVTLTAEVRGYIANMRAAAAATKDVAGDMTKMSQIHQQQWDKVSGGMLKSGTALTALSLASGKAAIDWQSQFAGVRKTVDATEDQYAQLEEQLRGMAKTMPATHQEIAAVAEAAGQLGVKREDIVGFTETMIQLGETTNLTADQAATSIAQIQNVMGTAPENIDNFGAALVDLGNNGASTEAEILAMTQRIAAAGAQAGMSESDVLGFANALASVGVEAEAGGTAISTTFKQVDNAVREGGPKLELLAEVAGMTAQEFQTAWGEDSASAMTAFIEGLGGMQAAGKDVNGTLKDLGVEGIRQSDSILRLANATQAAGGKYNLLRDSIQRGAEAWAEGTALQDEYAKRAETDAARIQVAWNKVKDAAITAGGAIAPVLTAGAELVGGLANAFSSLPGPVKSGIGILAGFSGAALLAVGAGIKIVGAVASMRTAFGTLKTAVVTPMQAFRSEMALAAQKASGAYGPLNRVNGALVPIAGTSVRATGGLRGATGAMGALKGAGSGLVSFLGGPWGAALAVGGLALGVFADRQAEAAERAMQHEQRIKALMETLDPVSGAATKSTREMVANELASSDAANQLVEWGVARDTVINAAMGDQTALDAINEKFDEQVASADAAADANKNYDKAARQSRSGFSQTEQQVRKQTEAMSVSREQVTGWTKDIQEAGEKQRNLKQWTEEGSKNLKDQTIAVKANASAYPEWARGMTDAQLAAQTFNGVVYETKGQLKSAREEFGKFSTAFAGATSFTDAVDAAVKSHAIAVEKETNKAGDSWEDYADIADVSLKRIITSMNKQITARNNWQKNLQTLLAEGMDPAAVNALLEKGIDYAPVVQKLVDADPKIRGQFERTFLKAGEEGNAAAARGFQDFERRISQVVELGGEKARRKFNEVWQKTGSVEKALKSVGMKIDVTGNVVPLKKAVQKGKEDAEKTKPVIDIDGNANGVRSEGKKGAADAAKNKPVIDIDGDAGPARSEAKGAKTYADGLRGVISLFADDSSARASILALNGMRVFVDVVMRGLSGGGRGRAGVTAKADGGIVDFFADGDIRDGHTAQIVPAGTYRVFGEDETGGEAYIPLAPHKRPRSVSIWRETGRRLGVLGFADGAVVNFAGGGFAGGSSVVGELQLSDILQLLAESLSSRADRVSGASDRLKELRKSAAEVNRELAIAQRNAAKTKGVKGREDEHKKYLKDVNDLLSRQRWHVGAIDKAEDQLAAARKKANVPVADQFLTSARRTNRRDRAFVQAAEKLTKHGPKAAELASELLADGSDEARRELLSLANSPAWKINQTLRERATSQGLDARRQRFLDKYSPEAKAERAERAKEAREDRLQKAKEAAAAQKDRADQLAELRAWRRDIIGPARYVPTTPALTPAVHVHLDNVRVELGGQALDGVVTTGATRVVQSAIRDALGRG